MYIEKSIKEINNFIKKISINNLDNFNNLKKIQTIDITKIFYNVNKNKLFNIQEEFQILNNLYNCYNLKNEFYTIIDDNIIVSPIDLEEHIKSWKFEFSEINNNLLYWEYIDSYYYEIDYNDTNEICKYYIYDLIIQKYNFFNNIWLKIEKVYIELNDFFEEKSKVIFIIKLTKDDFKSLINNKIKIYKSYIEKLEHSNFQIIKTKIINYINFLDEYQLKNWKWILIKKFEEYTFETLLKVLSILLFEKNIIIRNFNIFSDILEIDLIKNKKAELNKLDRKKIFDKINDYLNDNNCKEIIINKDSKWNIDFLYCKKILKWYKYIDIQKLYPFANIISKTHKWKSDFFIVEEKFKFDKNIFLDKI